MNDYYNNQKWPPQPQYDPLTQKFKDNYPTKYVLIHSFLIVLLSLAAIAIQVVLIVYAAPLSLLSSGIWIGVFYIIAVILALLNIKLPGYCLYTASSLMHSLGIMMSMTALISVNVIAYTSLYKCTTTSTDVTQAAYSLLGTMSTYKCGSPDPLHIALMVIGACFIILSIVFLCVMACTLGECGGGCNNRVNSNQNQPPNYYKNQQQQHMMYPPPQNRMNY